MTSILHDLAAALGVAFVDFRQRRATAAFERDLLKKRPAIVHVGPIDRARDGTLIICEGWQFNMPPIWAAHPWASQRWSDGQWRIFGYTQAELESIHARRAEFNVDA